jgi:primase-polymerase (primpol)-like protein
MKKLSTILAAGTMALALSTPVLAGSVGVSRSYTSAQPDSQTIADLQQASEDAQREAREGNKDNPAFAQKSYQIDQLVERIKAGEQVSQSQVDQALQPVWIW